MPPEGRRGRRRKKKSLHRFSIFIRGASRPTKIYRSIYYTVLFPRPLIIPVTSPPVASRLFRPVVSPLKSRVKVKKISLFRGSFSPSMEIRKKPRRFLRRKVAEQLTRGVFFIRGRKYGDEVWRRRKEETERRISQRSSKRTIPRVLQFRSSRRLLHG